jgi:hypothetical protein
MLHKTLAAYLDSIENAQQNLTDVYAEKYEEEILTFDRANLRIRLRFSNGSLLEINEAVMVEMQKLSFLSYRYHYQNKQNQLIFRYDNTPHFPDLATFPHHKHLENKVIATEKPDLTDVMTEAAQKQIHSM